MRRSALERRSSLPQHCLCHGRPAALKDAGLRWRTSSPRRLALRSCSFDPPDSQLLGERTHCRCSFDLLVYTTDDVEVPPPPANLHAISHQSRTLSAHLGPPTASRCRARGRSRTQSTSQRRTRCGGGPRVPRARRPPGSSELRLRPHPHPLSRAGQAALLHHSHTPSRRVRVLQGGRVTGSAGRRFYLTVSIPPRYGALGRRPRSR